MRKRITRRFTLVPLLLTLIWGCSEKQPSARAADSTVQHLPAGEVQKMIAENPQIPIIDVRTQPEFTGELGHIAGAQLKPLQDIGNWVSQIDSLKDQTIILVCRSGNRSGQAANYLAKRGFKHLINVKGGMIDWNKNQYPIEK
jgi:rhodanese-related sulfurtransferase